MRGGSELFTETEGILLILFWFIVAVVSVVLIAMSDKIQPKNPTLVQIAAGIILFGSCFAMIFWFYQNYYT